MSSLYTIIQKNRFTFKINITFVSCHESWNQDKIFTCTLKSQRPDSISIRISKNTKFICLHAKCKQSHSIEKLNNHEIYECNPRCTQCPTPYCLFTNNVKTVFNHLIKYPVHLIYCGWCNTLSNVAVLTHDCKKLNDKQTLSFQFKYFYKQ